MVWACILDSDIQDVVKIDRLVDTKKYHQSWVAMQYHLHQINSLIFSMTAIPTMALLQEKHSRIKKKHRAPLSWQRREHKAVDIQGRTLEHPLRRQLSLKLI